MPQIPSWLQPKLKVVANFADHKEKWKWCRGCNLCNGRQSVVLARGTIPCDVLFVGEAPGESEDTLGKPFIGPAGKLLDEMIEESIEGLFTTEADGDEHEIRTAFTNLVACIPRNPEGSTIPPDKTQIIACATRLSEFVNLTKPKLIVCVGKLAKEWLDADNSEGIGIASIIHPAAILRSPVSQRSLEIQNTVRVLRDSMEEI